MVIATVTLLPALSVPDIGVTFSLSRSQSGSEIDHATGPLLAVSVSHPPCRGRSVTVVGDADSVPVAGEPGEVGGQDAGRDLNGHRFPPGGDPRCPRGQA